METRNIARLSFRLVRNSTLERRKRYGNFNAASRHLTKHARTLTRALTVNSGKKNSSRNLLIVLDRVEESSSYQAAVSKLFTSKASRVGDLFLGIIYTVREYRIEARVPRTGEKLFPHESPNRDSQKGCNYSQVPPPFVRRRPTSS